MEVKIYNFLMKYCQGKQNLIKNKDLRLLFDVGSDKSLRKIIQNIRESTDYKHVVGSVSGKSGSFYICINEEEILETIKNIEHRANQMLRMSYVLKWKRDKYNG